MSYRLDRRGEISMKSLKLALLATAMTMGVAAAAHAADATPPVEATPTPEQYQAMGYYLRGDLGWSFLDWGDSDNAIDVGGGVGYRYRELMISGEDPSDHSALAGIRFKF